MQSETMLQCSIDENVHYRTPIQKKIKRIHTSIVADTAPPLVSHGKPISVTKRLPLASSQSLFIHASYSSKGIRGTKYDFSGKRLGPSIHASLRCLDCLGRPVRCVGASAASKPKASTQSSGTFASGTSFFKSVGDHTLSMMVFKSPAGSAHRPNRKPVLAALFAWYQRQ